MRQNDVEQELNDRKMCTLGMRQISLHIYCFHRCILLCKTLNPLKCGCKHRGHIVTEIKLLWKWSNYTRPTPIQVDYIVMLSAATTTLWQFCECYTSLWHLFDDRCYSVHSKCICVRIVCKNPKPILSHFFCTQWPFYCNDCCFFFFPCFVLVWFGFFVSSMLFRFLTSRFVIYLFALNDNFVFVFFLFFAKTEKKSHWFIAQKLCVCLLQNKVQKF